MTNCVKKSFSYKILRKEGALASSFCAYGTDFSVKAPKKIAEKDEFFTKNITKPH